MEVVGFAIGDQDLAALRRIAKEEERTIAYLLRHLVESYVRRRSA